MNEPSLLDWITGVGPILISWPAVILLAIFLFRDSLLKLLHKLTQDDLQKAKIGPFEIQESQETETKTLKFLVDRFVSKPELTHLQTLNDGKPFPYDKAPYFVSELQRLRSLDLIQLIKEIDDLPPTGDLQDYANITEEGKQYLSLRDHAKQD